MMRNFLYITAVALVFLGSTSTGFTQDLPLFTQKLTNSFLYNPSVAGNGMGSLTFSNRSFWNNVPGAPKSNFLSLHMPFAYHKMGVGLNIMSEKIGVYDNLFANGAYAYHIKFRENMGLSMGVSAEYASLRINSGRIDVVDDSDALLNGSPTRNSLDFSFGMSFHTRLFEVGLSSNRLATALKISDFETQITQFYTGYIKGKFELTEGHLVEPMFTYRQLTDQTAQWDAGAFYTFRETVILGASYRQDGIINPSIGLRFQNKFLVGYSFEMFGNGLQPTIGATNEITLRLDLRDDNYARNTKNSFEIMQNSVNFRRKTMSSNTFRSKPIPASSAKYKKKLKRNYIKSPSYRMNNSPKLKSSKLHSPKNKYSKKKKRRSNYGSKKKKLYKSPVQRNSPPPKQKKKR